MRELLAYSQGAVVEEKLTLRIKADDNGNIYVPTAGYSPDGTQNCSYNWSIGVDDIAPVNYSGTGSSNSKIRVGYGLVPLSIHTVIIRPVEEDYGWLRAFGYKGTNVASSLINIVSDKSYMGYALSSQYSGDWYKAYQYYGCSNLINTDEELLPDTLEIIGDNYRYYEYAGCISLVHNAEEKILKTVKVIGDNYRAYQYENCYGINKINMRAINWASVGNNYRLNQYSGIATDKKPADIYIEGGIEEGGNWGLTDTRVKNIYVYELLVADYQTKFSTITSSKIKKNSDWDNLEYEFIEYIGIADSDGEIRIPVGGYSTSGNQDCEYDWLVSIDGGEAEEITGTGSDGYVSVGSGLTEGDEYRVVIKPKTIGWGWGRAFGFYGTGAEGYIKEIIHDSYKCYAISRVNTGNYYKYRTYRGCVNIVNSYEKLPTSVTTIGNNYMRGCNYGCSGLKTAFWEVLHKSCSIGSSYRYMQYADCGSMEEHQGMAGYMGNTYPSEYKDNYFSNAGNNLSIDITRLEKMYTLDFASGNYYSGGTITLATITRAGRYIFSGNLQGTSSNTWFDIRIYQNNTLIYSDTAPDPGTKFIKFDLNCQVGDVIQIRPGTEQRYGNMNTMKLEYSNVLGIDNNKIGGINVFVDNLYDYKNNNAWSDVSSSKFKVYYFDYQPIPAVDISKYTTLVETYSVPSILYDSSNTRLYSSYVVGRYVGVATIGTSDNQLYISGQRINLNNGAIYGALIKVIISGGNVVYGGSYIGTGGWATYYDGTVHGAYGDQKGNIIYSSEDRDYSGGGYMQYRILSGRIYDKINTDASNFTAGLCAGRDGRSIFWQNRAYYTTTRWGGGGVQVGTYTGDYTGMDISDDGMTAYLQTNLGEIKQYSLSAPRDLSNKTDTGKSLNISGNFAISKDKKYLFVWDGSIKIYQYTE